MSGDQAEFVFEHIDGIYPPPILYAAGNYVPEPLDDGNVPDVMLVMPEFLRGRIDKESAIVYHYLFHEQDMGPYMDFARNRRPGPQ